jgi:hypothetical protein
LTVLAWLWLAFASNGLCQGNSQFQVYPYTGPTVVFPDTQITFGFYAPGAIACDSLSGPTNAEAFMSYGGRGDEQVPGVVWQTPSRSAIGTTNTFVLRVFSGDVPPLTATGTVSLVVMDVPPMRFLTISNRVALLQFTNPLPYYYQGYTVQWTDSLATTNWSELTRVFDIIPMITVADTNPPVSQRFYKLAPVGGWVYGVIPP